MSKLTADAIAGTFKSVTQEKRLKALTPKTGATNAEEIRTEQLPAQARGGQDGSHGFKNPREFLLTVMKAYKNGSEFDPRLIELYEPNIEAIKNGETVRKAVGSDEARTISDPYGGFLVPTTFTPDMLKIDPEEDPIGARTRKIP